MDEKKSYEKIIEDLEIIVSKLEKGELSLDESLLLFQQGIELTRLAGRKLDETEKRITYLIENEAGELSEVPFDSEED